MPVMYVLTTWTKMGIPGTFGSFARISVATTLFFIVAAPVLFILLDRPFLARAKAAPKPAKSSLQLPAPTGSSTTDMSTPESQINLDSPPVHVVHPIVPVDRSL
jgi:hypothetical protein